MTVALFVESKSSIAKGSLFVCFKQFCKSQKKRAKPAAMTSQSNILCFINKIQNSLLKLNEDTLNKHNMMVLLRMWSIKDFSCEFMKMGRIFI